LSVIYCVTIHDDDDVEYVEELLRAASKSARGEVDIHEAKPIPARRRRRAAQTTNNQNLRTTADNS